MFISLRVLAPPPEEGGPAIVWLRECHGVWLSRPEAWASSSWGAVVQPEAQDFTGLVAKDKQVHE